MKNGAGIFVSCSTGVVSITSSSIRNAEEGGVVVSDDAPDPGYTCLNVSRPYGVFLHDNLIRGNGGDGVSFLIGSAYTVEGTILRGNAGDGVFLDSDVTDSLLMDNLARANGDDGFQLDNADLELTNNAARGNTGYGFETNFVGPVLLDNGQTARNNSAGNCSDPSDLPNTNR